MRKLFACFVVAGFTAPAALFGQLGTRAHALGGLPSFNAYPITSPTAAPALGGLPVNSRPLGGVPLPGARSKQNRAVGSGYVGPVYYVPSASDYADADFWSSVYGPPVNGGVAFQPPPLPVQPPPIIINQYFDTKRPAVPQQDTAPPVQDNSAPNPGDPLSDPQNYYLIEYKDHTVYTALAYWLEGDTLHYVTTQNTHNQASLSLIDLDKTYKLNEDRSVPFSIPGR